MNSLALTILGSGTAVPTADRGAASYLVTTGSESLMLDCGPGSTRRLPLAGIELIDIDHLLISHFHVDHVCDLAAFLFGSRIPGYQRTKPLKLIGPVGLKTHYNRLVDLFGQWLLSPDYQMEIIELDTAQGAATIELASVRVTAQTVAHSNPAIGYRLESGGRVLTYSGDTDYCETIVDLCQGADLAILECSTPDGQKIPKHLTPGLAGQIATEAGVAQLVLSHFYPMCQPAEILAQCQRCYQGKISLAMDLMSYTV